MRLKTKLVLAITGMIVALVMTFSYIYLSQLLRQHINAAYNTATLLSRELQDAATDAQPDFRSTKVAASAPKPLRAALVETLQTDPNLGTFLDSIVANSPIIYDAAVVDFDDKAILHTDMDLIGSMLPDRPDLTQLRDAGFRQQLNMVFRAPGIYEVRLPLELNDAPFGTVRVGVSTVFLKNEIQPHLVRAMWFSGIAILISLVLAAGLSNLALGPLARISRRLDSVTAGDVDTMGEDVERRDEYGMVTLKIAHLGRQMRDVQEVFSALKDNLDQIMSNMQDGLMLFTRDARVVLVSASAERFVGRPRGEMLGRNVSDVFSNSTRLGRMVLEAFQSRKPVLQGEVEGENDRPMQVSLD